MVKRIVLTSVGSFGDLHPFISVALELRSRGFEPVIAASEGYRRKVTAENLPFYPVAPAPEQLQRDTGLSKGEILQRLTTRFIIDKAVTPYQERSYKDLLEAMNGSCLVVACNFSMVARIAAASLELPVVSLLLSPCVFFSAEEPAHLLEAPWLRTFRQVFGSRATRFIFDLRRMKSRWQTRQIRRFRRRLGVVVPRGDELLDGPLQADWIYGLYSPVLGHLLSDAPSNSSLAGYTFYDSHEGGRAALPTGLKAFLAAGTMPLVFTLGSTGVYAPENFYDDAVETARRLERRAVLLVGPKLADRFSHLSSDEVFVAPYAPHSLIFPHAAAVIHHGGIGTVGQALRAGQVQLVCPMLGDQADNAERLVRLGVARRLDHRRFTVDRAVAALMELLNDEVASRRAAALGAQVASEDGGFVVAEGIIRLLNHAQFRKRSTASLTRNAGLQRPGPCRQ